MAKKQNSEALPDEDFNPSDFKLTGPLDKVVSKVSNGEKVFNVFNEKTISNLSLSKDGLIDGVWSIEEEKTLQVIEAMKAALEKKAEPVTEDTGEKK
jgi:hypothetical protein